MAPDLENRFLACPLPRTGSRSELFKGGFYEYTILSQKGRGSGRALHGIGGPVDIAFACGWLHRRSAGKVQMAENRKLLYR